MRVIRIYDNNNADNSKVIIIMVIKILIRNIKNNNKEQQLVSLLVLSPFFILPSFRGTLWYVMSSLPKASCIIIVINIHTWFST